MCVWGGGIGIGLLTCPSVCGGEREKGRGRVTETKSGPDCVKLVCV